MASAKVPGIRASSPPSVPSNQSSTALISIMFKRRDPMLFPAHFSKGIGEHEMSVSAVRPLFSSNPTSSSL
jgi:hypothetical protein